MTTQKAPKTSLKPSSEEQESLPEEKSTSEVDTARITLEEYLKNTNINPGLIASFNYEAALIGTELAPNTVEGWDQAFKEQSSKSYN